MESMVAYNLGQNKNAVLYRISYVKIILKSCRDVQLFSFSAPMLMHLNKTKSSVVIAYQKSISYSRVLH